MDETLFKDPYRKALLELVRSIDEAIGLSEENGVLILWKLDTHEKISRFNRWVQSRLHNGKLQATEAEVVRAAVQVSKGIL